MDHITFNNTSVPKKIILKNDVKEFGELQDGIVPVFSGKTALVHVLHFFRSTGKLENKSAEILVPPWIGYWVYMMMNTECFPTREDNSRVRGMLVYHQWGFPQRMEEILKFAKKRDFFIIEDCAHAFEGYYRGQRLGTFGDAAIFSMAKFFPCVVGGAVYSADTSIRSFVNVRTKVGSLEKKLFNERKKTDEGKKALSLSQQYAMYPNLGGCVPKALYIARYSVAGGALQKRKQNVERLRRELQPTDEFDLFEEGVIPWVVPIFFEKEMMRRVVKALAAVGVETGIYHFDINRNILAPDYRECVALPCHDGISEKEISRMIDIVRSV
ncbi:MAG: AtaP4 protein [Candidatus Kaiserbacteria bacterium GW2011_GWB1_52_6]|uniref:AtaP4 protein n=2 Tax=Candidatus Kaiseribacteriota TaxID=1752734 RepID=A0A0G1XL18_9BACT|nr:MAG: AtaP4 protein [Candidatus Kaiserbacteria bacterium GW2011_GWB1_52_6]KKW31565.1 MAG: AtaP4 protein [Candidatus Kaiserbacteria bacterium GW2011_GWC2_52_8b]